MKKITDWLIPTAIDSARKLEGAEGRGSSSGEEKASTPKRSTSVSPQSAGSKESNVFKMPKEKKSSIKAADSTKDHQSPVSSTGSGGTGGSKSGSKKQPGGGSPKKGEASSSTSSSKGQASSSTSSHKSQASSSTSSSKAQASSSGTSGGTPSSGGEPASHSCREQPDVVLPQARVKVIMKSSPDIEQVGQDVVYLITKATECFVDHVTTQTYNQAHKVKNVEYKHLAEMTQKQSNLEFLRDIIPLKMTARDALKEMAKQKAQENKELLE